jgi:hypothetical protein
VLAISKEGVVTKGDGHTWAITIWVTGLSPADVPGLKLDGSERTATVTVLSVFTS